MPLTLLPGALIASLGTAAFTLSTATENVSLVGAGSFTAFALAGFGLMWRAWSKENSRLQHSLDLYVLRVDLLEQRNEFLKLMLDENGVRIPPGYWQAKETP